jgi:hypothetical protein
LVYRNEKKEEPKRIMATVLVFTAFQKLQDGRDILPVFQFKSGSISCDKMGLKF